MERDAFDEAGQNLPRRRFRWGLRRIVHEVNGRKWWTSGALDPRCKIMIVVDAPRTEPSGRDLEAASLAEQHTGCRDPDIVEKNFGVAMRRLVIAKDRQHPLDEEPETESKLCAIMNDLPPMSPSDRGGK